MFNFFKRKESIVKVKDDNVGKVIVDEVIPMFSDYANTSNKTVYILHKTIEKDKAVFKYSYNSTEIKIYRENKFITQNGKPIKIKDFQFTRGEFDFNYTKEGYEKGQIYKFKGMGYLGNLEDVSKVHLVTDQYVIFDEGARITLRSYGELERLYKEKL